MTVMGIWRAMLSRLSIRDIVLIDRLDIDFAEGLAVLNVEPVDQDDIEIGRAHV